MADGHQARGWPFSTTEVKELNSGAFLTDAGRLDAEDLGYKVVLALGAAKAALPVRNAQGTSSIDKPAITNIQTQQYHLVVPKELCCMLRDWQALARIVKNAAI